MIKQIQKNNEKIVFKTDMNISLANALRRSVNEIPLLAVDEVDIYKNDSALYDQIIAHRIGLIPLKNAKLKEGKKIEFKLKVHGGAVLSRDLVGADVVHDNVLIVSLEKDQEIELVARANIGTAEKHSKYSPGLVYYRYSYNIEISREGENQKELAELYPSIFQISDGKLKVKNDWECDLDKEDISEFRGIKITPTKNLVFFIESWGQIDAKDIFLGAVKVLRKNLDEIAKASK